MGYATQQDLVDRFGAEELVQLTDRAQAGTIDATVVGKALADADALMDGYLATRYAVPVTPTTALLTRLAADVARFLLHGKSATETVRQAHEDALRFLREIASGKASLIGAAPPPASQATGGPVLVAAPDRVFGRTAIGDFFG